MTVAERYRVAQADRTAGRVPGLDGLRGVAVVWVVAFHLWPDVVRGGWLGVSLFFTLSGYLILGLIDAEVSATGRLRLGRFMARRVRRLMPASLLTISATVALTAVLTDAPLREIGLDALTAVLNVFAIPIKESGVTYQHFNTGVGPTRMLVSWANLDSAISPEGGVAMEVLEPCPEWQAEHG